jgi:hypothetical protein
VQKNRFQFKKGRKKRFFSHHVSRMAESLFIFLFFLFTHSPSHNILILLLLKLIMSGKVWTVNPDVCLPIRMGEEGVSAWTPRTVAEMVVVNAYYDTCNIYILYIWAHGNPSVTTYHDYNSSRNL